MTWDRERADSALRCVGLTLIGDGAPEALGKGRFRVRAAGRMSLQGARQVVVRASEDGRWSVESRGEGVAGGGCAVSGGEG